MNYYNENDRKACAWLAELIKAGLIPAGEIDSRSIVDVQPGDLAGFVQCHFFAGIGGWAHALHLAGWPETHPVWTLSCPCQPFSVAGRGMGEDDERHLWPYARNLVGVCRPPVCFGEQVESPAGRAWLAGVFADLEDAHYRCAASDLCAAGVGAPHRRQRLYWVADNQGEGWPGMESKRQTGKLKRSWIWSSGATRFAPVAHAVEYRCGQGCDAEPGQEGGGALVEQSGRFVPGGVALGDSRQPRPQERPESEGGISMGNEGPAIVTPSSLAGTGATGGVADAASNGGAQHEHEPGERETKGPLHGAVSPGSTAWSRFDILPMRDGKSRRVESGTFPLAHGIPGRVAQLRGLGNAIVPQVAAEFIQAYLQTLTQSGAG